MRMFKKGELFMDVRTDHDPSLPVFSEEFLYEAIGKGEARFVLGVAEEYDRIIKLLGEDVTFGLLTASFSGSATSRLRSAIAEFLENEGT